MEIKEEIVKKEYMNSKLSSIRVPVSIKTVGDWAFANCKLLREVSIPVTLQRISPNCFYGCDSLKRIVIYEGEREDAMILPELVAVAVKLWDTDISKWIELSKRPETFYEHFDWRMSVYAKEPDDTGYVPFIAGGEEDYEGDEYDLDSFMRKRSEEKCLAMYLRLISEGRKIKPCEYIRDYLREHDPIGAFSVILSVEDFKKEMFDIYTSMDLLNDDNVDEILRLSANDPELKTRVLRFKEAQAGSFFDLL